MNQTIRQYHATWLGAAEQGLISHEVAMMLIDAFELGIVECSRIAHTLPTYHFAGQAIKQTADTRQVFINKGYNTTYSPTSLEVSNDYFKFSEMEVNSTINFRSRRTHQK